MITNKPACHTSWGVRRIDRYIARNFFSTYLVALTMFVLIAVVFDIAEKLEDFISRKVTLREIVFDYYLNFIPYFAALFTPLFVFISVIFFTSRLAFRSEIVSLFNAGITFQRLLVPYVLCSGVVLVANLYANHWLLPVTSRARLAFTNTYIGWRQINPDRHVHMQVAPSEFLYVENFSVPDSTGYQFAYEVFQHDLLVYKLRSERIIWNSTTRQWVLKHFAERRLGPFSETLRFGLDTSIAYPFTPSDLKKDHRLMESLTTPQLKQRIAELKMRGSAQVADYSVERYRRTSFPFAIPILTVIGVAMSSRKVRGGVGIHTGIGIALSFTYLLFLQFSQSFAVGGNLSPLVAVWLPNIVFGVLAILLVYRAMR